MDQLTALTTIIGVATLGVASIEDLNTGLVHDYTFYIGVSGALAVGTVIGGWSFLSSAASWTIGLLVVGLFASWVGAWYGADVIALASLGTFAAGYGVPWAMIGTVVPLQSAMIYQWATDRQLPIVPVFLIGLLLGLGLKVVA